jgi:hypothetical protein
MIWIARYTCEGKLYAYMKQAECQGIPLRKQDVVIKERPLRGRLLRELGARGRFRNEDMQYEKERGFRIQGMSSG